jgi:hypothetical protein
MSSRACGPPVNIVSTRIMLICSSIPTSRKPVVHKWPRNDTCDLFEINKYLNGPDRSAQHPP